MLSTLSFILNHPLNRGHRLSALRRFFLWQIVSRAIKLPVAIPYVNATRLLIAKGMHGATGNYYCGLHEYSDMGFMLHYLRDSDIFFDIGANVGSYTILAAGVIGAKTISVEPIPDTYEKLLDNININRLGNLVISKNIGIGSSKKTLSFSTGLDTVNRVVAEGETPDFPVIEVPVIGLDELTEQYSPSLIKIDVEGFEAEVLAGGMQTLKNPALQAVIMELNGSGKRFGFDEESLHRQMIDSGFETFQYDPQARELKSLNRGRNVTGNTLYLRDWESVNDRLKKAPPYRVLGQAI